MGDQTDYKARVSQALNRYYQRQLRQSKTKRQARNKSPEKQVAKDCVAYLQSIGATVQIIESKAVWSARAGRYLRGQTSSGTSDLIGVLPTGVACFVEFKAPGRLSTLRPHQREYLVNKINSYAFAACVDSAESLTRAYMSYACTVVIDDKEVARNLLLDLLPTIKESDDESLDL